MRDHEKEQVDPLAYINEVTINSGFIPYYEFVDDMAFYKREREQDK